MACWLQSLPAGLQGISTSMATGVLAGRWVWTQALAGGLTAGMWGLYALLASAKVAMSARNMCTKRAWPRFVPHSSRAACQVYSEYLMGKQRGL